MYKFPENFRLADNVHLVPVQPLRKQDNVGIYCRVSTYERKQMKSLMAQISALTRMV
jgi:site-specific DNA recombinase